ncbi:MAG: hypothetical protein FWF53_08655 [Candidatus Azobacteroides sp.]|nr:hypothetical protein [Candidatus Azobacteroides sp.]
MLLLRGDEYNIAVQNPRIAFTDADLKNSSVETTPLGLPKPYSGGFTITYKLSNNQAIWAVKCFHRDIQDLQRRYQSIGNFFSKNPSSYFVDARYLAEGIKINEKGYPIIKMRWIEGDPLNIYLSKSYNRKNNVEKLLADFVQLINELEKFGIAHGDLQHGNIIVKNDKLHLIDYDGMYLPELASLQTNEIGHPNYQHPKRSASQYNKDIDRFSEVVIYLGLKAISINPNLWQKYDNSENILFKNQDFINPQQSLLIKDLLAIPEIKTSIDRLVMCCGLDFAKIPSLKDFLSGNFVYSPPTSSSIPPISISPRNPYVILNGREMDSILKHFGEKVEVIGIISAIRRSTTQYGDPYVFLNFGYWPDHTFTLVLWKEGLFDLQKKGITPDSFVGKYVSAIGVIGSYKGKPQTTIELANQIQVLSGQMEANQRLQHKPIQSTTTAIPPIPTTKKDDNKEKRVFDDLYKNKPIYTPPKPRISEPPKTTVTTPPKTIYKPPTTTYSSSTQTTKQPTSSKNGGGGGCLVCVVGAIVGALIFSAISPAAFVVGGVLGLGASAWIYNAFKS